MKKAIAFLLISWISLNISAAQIDTNVISSNDIDTAAMLAFFEANNIVIDSCVNKQLYAEVYHWIGTPYRYAGKSKKGIDCSGFSNKVYENVFGQSLSGGSKTIVKNTETITRENAQEGDLVFFKIRKNQVSHVGIYLQNGKFAHASTRSGVIISDLSENYYNRFFYKIGRISEVSTGN